MSNEVATEAPEVTDTTVDFNWEQEGFKSEQQSWTAFFQSLTTVWELSKPERPRLVRSFVFITVRTMFEPVAAYVLASIVAAAPLVRTAGSLRYVYALLVAFATLRVLDVILDQFFASKNFWSAIVRLWYRWPLECQMKLLELPAEFHERHGMSKQVSKITKGCNQLGNATIDLYYSFLPAVAFWFANMIILLAMSWTTTLVLMLPIFLGTMLYGHMRRKLTPLWEKIEQRSEESTKHLIQGVVNAHMVQAYVQEQFLIDEQVADRNETIAMEDHSNDSERPYFVVMMSLLALGFVLSVAVSFWQMQRAQLTAGQLAYVAVTGWTTVMKFWEVTYMYRRMLRNGVTIERVRMLLNLTNTMPNNPEAPTLDASTYELSADHVTYQYPGKTNHVIKGVDLVIPAGKMVAFVGSSGAGKSTIMKLLMQVYNPTSGAIRLNGHDVRTLSRDWFRGLFASVSQDPAVLDRSIKDNVRFGTPTATDKEVEDALRAAHLDVVIADRERFPEGVETIVGERGAMISGGERQRIGIARAYLKLLHGAKFLVLDEATSSLDSEAEAAIQKVVDTLRASHSITIIVTAHRLSTIKNADLICVFERGELIERGTHKELVKHGGRYASLVSRQNLYTVHDAFVG